VTKVGKNYRKKIIGYVLKKDRENNVKVIVTLKMLM
jgi:hypothetical protein